MPSLLRHCIVVQMYLRRSNEFYNDTRFGKVKN